VTATESEAWLAQADKDTWQTPAWLHESINDICSIDLDPCAALDTDIGKTNWSIERGEDGLEREWFGTVFVNPPFSEKREWVEKVITEQTNTELILLVTPDSTDVQSWWHDGIVPHASYVWFSDGRISYVHPDDEQTANSPTFGTSISIFGEPEEELLQWLCERGWLVTEVEAV